MGQRFQVLLQKYSEVAMHIRLILVFLCPVNLIWGMVGGEGFIRVQAFMFLEYFCNVTPQCLHFIKLLELFYLVLHTLQFHLERME